ncbi:MAG: hypothetical protein K2Q17_04140 [Nitrospiraceae bacterium]|uniref:hypothetical protein n=1 Tax=Nitrospira cf. moscoviensis SBR1015 TaxID=96242 RepID=UPI0011206971|nr:hypothetical protein [Nitrospira cf. moscoviensis SBR1015]MBY0246839.1 hypothetical protein [Nitrospiraceae bacterium]
MSSQSIQESAETLLHRRGRVSTLCLSVMLAGAFSVSLMAGPANAGDRKHDRDDDNDKKHSLVMRPYSDHNLRYMVMQLQREVENLKKEIAARPAGTGTSTGPSLTDFNALKTRVADAETMLGQHTTSLTEVKSNPVLSLKDYLRVETTAVNGMLGPHIIFTGANVHVRNGANATTTTNSLGNLVLGYNETAQGVARDGSHNLVSGQGNSFRSFGGLVFGTDNVISGQFATVLGGGQNRAIAPYSTVIGSMQNVSDSNYEITPMPQSGGGSTGGGGF